MKMNRLTKLLVAGGALVFLSATSMLAGAQSAPPAPVSTPRKTTSRPIRTKKEPGPMDDFAGLNFTDDQKARINKIHEDFKARMDAVIKDEKLSADQKGAMLQGFQHMQRGEVYKVLTPDQQTEVRKRILARRTEAKKEQDKTKQPTPAPQVSPTPQPAQKPQSSKPPQPPAA
jgi:Spy/CpxP family protein refolding chaperone